MPLHSAMGHGAAGRIGTAPEALLYRNLSLRHSELFSDIHGPARLRIAGGVFSQAESVGNLISTGTDKSNWSRQDRGLSVCR